MIHPLDPRAGRCVSRLSAALTALICVHAALPAYARAAPSPPPGGSVTVHHRHVGNGRHNRNVVSVRSPTHNHGFQHTNNGNSGGLNNTQNSLCHHSTVCNITQKIIIIEPERPAPPAEAPESTGQPEATPPPEEIKPAISPAAAPETPPAKAQPFMYVGPFGFMLLTPGSSAPFGFHARGFTFPQATFSR
jgi:hypothetical protein